MAATPLEHPSKYSCTECKRRRIRCSRSLPVCASCDRTKRHCLYEHSKKLPLTRRHLTEVEEELALVKKLHGRLLPHVDYAPMLKRLKNGAELGDLDAPAAQVDNPNRDPPFPPEPAPVRAESAEKDPIPPAKALFDASKQIPQVFPSSVASSGQNDQNTTTSPYSGRSRSNNHWDERSRSTNGKAPFMINGMATIDADIFLGSTSSAALINLVGGEYFLHEAASGDGSETQNEKVTKLPARLLLEQYVGSYFDTYHVLYPIVNRPVFLAQFNDIIDAPPHFQSLLYIVAAIGSFMSAETSARCDDLDLFQVSKSFLSIDDFETGNLTLVQILALMSNYLQKRDKPNLGYNYLGLAVRMAMGLGLHKRLANPDQSLFATEVRKRIWWCLYIFDCGQTITYGRPLGSPCAGIDTELPFNVADSNLTSTTTVAKEETCPTVYTAVRLQLQFHVVTNSIYERLISDPFPSADELLEWDTQYIQKWRAQLPEFYGESAEVAPPFMLAHAVLHWRYRNFRILMYRTFALRQIPPSLPPHILPEHHAKNICLLECNATIHSITSFWNKKPRPNRMDTWYSLYFLIPAVVMPLICLRNDPELAESAKWIDDIMLAEQLVEKLKAVCPAATRILDLIFSVGRDFLPSQYRDLNSRDLPELSMEESPMSQLIQLHLMLQPGFFD